MRHQSPLRLPARLSARLRDERGAVLAIVGVLLIALLGAAALAVDLGSGRQSRTQVQSAADAAAIAAADQMSNGTTAMNTAAQTVGTANYPSAEVGTPVVSGRRVTVTVAGNSSTFFGKLFGATNQRVSASATAQATASGGATAVYADDDDCFGDLSITGAGLTIGSSIISNGNMNITSAGSSFGTVTYGGANNCAGAFIGVGTTYASGPTRTTTEANYPVDYRGSTPPCTTTSAGTIAWIAVNLNLNGVYCSNTSISINATNLSGTATFIAPRIDVVVTNSTLTPYSTANNLEFYATGSSGISITANNLNGGTIFAPNGPINFTATNSNLVNGFIEGDKVAITAANLTMTGTGPSVSTGASSLVG